MSHLYGESLGAPLGASCFDVEPQGWTSLAACEVSQLLCSGSWGSGEDHYNPFPGLVDLDRERSRLSVTSGRRGRWQRGH